ncbi:hypothetical protein QTP88_017099 [Uroleucon formosanum]
MHRNFSGLKSMGTETGISKNNRAETGTDIFVCPATGIIIEVSVLRIYKYYTYESCAIGPRPFSAKNVCSAVHYSHGGRIGFCNRCSYIVALRYALVLRCASAHEAYGRADGGVRIFPVTRSQGSPLSLLLLLLAPFGLQPQQLLLLGYATDRIHRDTR